MEKVMELKALEENVADEWHNKAQELNASGR